MGIEELSAQQSSFLEKFFGISSDGGSEKNIAPSQISLVKLGKARLEWGTVRDAAVSSVDALANTLQEQYGDDEDARDALPTALKTLSSAMSKINSKLEDQLDAVLNADGGDRFKLARIPVSTATDYIALCDSDPVLAALDGNEFMPDMRVTNPMKQALSRVMAALGQ